MKEEVLEEVKNLLEGRSGRLNVTMVNHKFTLEVQGTEGAYFLMLMFLISVIAKKEGMSYKECLDFLWSICQLE